MSAHTERTGAKVLAEGIETEAHLETALSLGSTLGQGWLFGRPGPLPQPLPPVKPWDAIPLLSTPPPVHSTQTPFEILHGNREVLEANERVLASMSRNLEERATELGRRGVVLAAFQERRHLTLPTFERYLQLARSGSFVGLCAEGISGIEIPDVAKGEIGPRDRLRNEWAVIVIGPHFAGGMAALETTSDPGMRTFAFGITHQREMVVRMGHSLIARLEHGSA